MCMGHVEMRELSLAAMRVQGKVRMLQTVLEYMPLMATMREVDIPGLSSGDITFQGVVSSKDYQSIIASAKVCLNSRLTRLFDH